MKSFTRKQAQKYIEKRLNDLSKQGYNISNILKGKTIEKMAWSKNSLNEFKKLVNREKQREKIKQEVKRIDIKLAEKREQRKIENQRRAKRNYISKTTKAIAKFNLNIEPTKMNIRKITSLEADKFFDRYFNSIKGDVQLESKINQLKKRFGNRLDLLHDFIDKVTQIDFNYEIDGVIFSREQFETEFSDDWNNMMSDRLDKMFSILNSKEFRI